MRSRYAYTACQLIAVQDCIYRRAPGIAGSGLLAVLAAGAGADTVVACDLHEPLAAVARRVRLDVASFSRVLTVSANACTDRVSMIAVLVMGVATDQGASHFLCIATHLSSNMTSALNPAFSFHVSCCIIQVV